MRIAAVLTFAAALSAAGAPSAEGQSITVRGRVVDELTDEPVGASVVQLLTVRGQRVLTVMSDAGGAYQLTIPAAGKYKLRAERIGYFPRETGEITLDAGTTTVVQLFLSPAPFRFDSLLVSGKSEARLLPIEALIHGRLIDDETRLPLSGGGIELVVADRVIASTLSDNYGLFRLVTPKPGTYTIRAMRLGYQTGEHKDLKTVPGDTLRLDFHLSTKAVLLAPIIVTASAKEWLKRRTDSAMVEMYDRMARYAKTRTATYILRDSLKKFDGSPVPLSKIIAVFVMAPIPRIASCGGVSLYLNGGQYASDIPLDDAFSGTQLEAIEVYDAPRIPSEMAIPPFRSGGISHMLPCRVIALWTKRQ